MSELPAAIGRCQLRKVETFLESFRKNAKMIFDLLPKSILPPYYPSNVEPAYFILGCTWLGLPKLKFEFLDKLRKARAKAGMLWSKNAPDIPGNNQPPGYTIGGGYTKPLYDIPLYHKYRRSCPNTEFTIKNALWIDCHRWTTEETIHKNMDIFNSVYKSTL